VTHRATINAETKTKKLRMRFSLTQLGGSTLYQQ
jgi:hypothetical protein